MRLSRPLKYLAPLMLLALILTALPALASAQLLPKIVRHEIINDLKRTSRGEIVVTPARVFAPTDSYVMSFVELTGPFGVHEAKWEFHSPDGKIFQTTHKGINQSTMTDIIRVKNWPAAKLLGDWTVKFYINDQLKFEDQFQIIDPEAPGEPAPPDEPNDLKSFDTNNNNQIDDQEVFAVVDGWVDGSVTDALFFKLVDAWVSGEPVAASAQAKRQSSYSYRVYDLAGDLITFGRCAQNPGRLALKTLSGRQASPKIYLLVKQNCVTQRIERSFIRVMPH